MISDPNVSLRIFDCLLYTRRFALKDEYHKKKMDKLAFTPVEFNQLSTLAKFFFIQKNWLTMLQFVGLLLQWIQTLFWLACALKINFVITNLISDKLKYSGGQLIVDFDAAHNWRLYVTTLKALNFQNDISSIPIDNFKDHYLLVFDLIWMQDATENCHYAELVGEPLRLELNFTHPLEHVTELIVLGKRMSPVAVDKRGVVVKISKMDNISLQPSINCIPLLKYRYLGSLPSDYVSILPKETFAVLKTQPSIMQGEHWIMISNYRHKL